MKNTRTRIFIERHSVTVRHGPPESNLAVGITSSKLTATNVPGEYALGLASLVVSRFTRASGKRAGMIMTLIVLALLITIALLSRNFRWQVIVGFLMSPLIGFIGAGLGLVARRFNC